MPETASTTIPQTNEFMKSLVDELRGIATTKTVIGDPIEIAGRTLIPVISIMVGFGAGAGSGTGDMPSSENMKMSGMGEGLGVGGGGGVRIEPIAFIVIDKDNVEILPTKSAAGAINKIIDEAPELMDKAMEMGQKYMDRQKEMQGASKESK